VGVVRASSSELGSLPGQSERTSSAGEGVLCWSCERRVAGGDTCPQCNALLPPQPNTDHFRVLGLESRFSIDTGAAESSFRKKARQLHPDRFARADARARRVAMQRTVQLNEAWRTLKDPFARAAYLIDLKARREPADRGGGAGGVTMPQNFLMEMLERRDALGEAQEANDAAGIESLTTAARKAEADCMAALADLLDASGSVDTDSAAMALAKVKYHRRFLEEALVSSKRFSTMDLWQ